MRDVCCPLAAHRPGVLPEIDPESAAWDVEQTAAAQVVGDAIRGLLEPR